MPDELQDDPRPGPGEGPSTDPDEVQKRQRDLDIANDCGVEDRPEPPGLPAG